MDKGQESWIQKDAYDLARKARDSGFLLNERKCKERERVWPGDRVKLLETVRPFVNYVPVGGGGSQKSVVYQNFTPSQSNYIWQLHSNSPVPWQ